MLPGTARLVVIPPTCQQDTPCSPPISMCLPLNREFRDIITGLEYQARTCQHGGKNKAATEHLQQG